MFVDLYIPAFGGHFYIAHIYSCIPWELNSRPWLIVPCFTLLYTAGLYIGEYQLNECTQSYILTFLTEIGSFMSHDLLLAILLLVACRWYYGGHSQT